MKLKKSQIISLVTIAVTLVFAVWNSMAEVPKGYNTKIPENIMTPDKVKTRIGTLEFFDGLPSDKTAQKVFDNLDFMWVLKFS